MAKRKYTIYRGKHKPQDAPPPPAIDDAEALALAQQGCKACMGTGRTSFALNKRKRLCICYCVQRALFRVCYAEFQRIAKYTRVGSATLEANGGRHRYRFQMAKPDPATYIADFLVASRRVLEQDGKPDDAQLFRWHYILGADWKLCCKRLSIERGEFFHRLYRIERVLGLAFATMQPYPLYPPEQYYTTNWRTKGADSRPQVPPVVRNEPVRPPWQSAKPQRALAATSGM